MKNEARDAVANLRESIDRLVMFCGLDLREGLETGTDWEEFVMNTSPRAWVREMESITKIVDEMDKQVDVLEAIDDNDIMEHAYSQITPEDC